VGEIYNFGRGCCAALRKICNFAIRVHFDLQNEAREVKRKKCAAILINLLDKNASLLAFCQGKERSNIIFHANS
jgi:hypothetical protein